MIKQIRTSVEGEIRFEAEYDQGRGDWRDFQKESRDMIHPIVNILFLMCNLTAILTTSPWTWNSMTGSTVFASSRIMDFDTKLIAILEVNF